MQLNNVEDIYKLSPAQQGLLFHTLYDQAARAYFQQVVYTLRGALDATAFWRAWQQVVDRHPALRTAFLWQDMDEPLQVVRQQVGLPWVEHDWRAHPANRQRKLLEAILDEQRGRGFDLRESPLMNCTLIHIAEDTHWFIWNHHHIILDAWSVALVLGDVFAHYDAFRRRAPLALESPPHYRDYIAWLQQQDLAAAAAFWRQTLQGFAEPTMLPGAKAAEQPMAEPGAWTNQSITLSTALTTELVSLVQRHHLTLNTLVRSAWALLLSRSSGLDDIVFGATTSGRPAALPGVEAIVGLFINTLPVRVRIPRHADLLPWLHEIQAQQIQQERYAYSPLVEVQGWSDVPRGTPLFESLLVFENAPANSAAQVEQSGLTIADIRYDGWTNYPLTIGVVPGTELLFDVQYAANRFDSDAIARMIGHLQAILQAMAANPQQRLGDLPRMTQAEYRQIVVEWNANTVRYPVPGCLHDLFAQQAAGAPDAVALVYAGTGDWGLGTGDWETARTPNPQSPIPNPQLLTYRELNQRANQLARYLTRLGIGPEALVALYLDRSPAMVVAILGVLKAGAAYVPLDPSYPAERLAFMLADAQVALLLTTTDQRPTTNDQRPTTNDQRPTTNGGEPRTKNQEPRMDDDPITQNLKLKTQNCSPSPLHPFTPSGSVVYLDADWPAIAAAPAIDPAVAVSADSAAYLLYTSGSTGQPKGVIGLQRGVLNRVAWMAQLLPFGADEVGAHKTALSFVDSVWELFGPLLHGRRVLVLAPSLLNQVPQFLAALARERVTRLVLVPSLLELLLTSYPDLAQRLPALRCWIVSGEVLPGELVTRFRAQLAGRTLLNLYGSSEVAADVTWYDTRCWPGPPAPVPIGRPIANTQVYLLDGELRPVGVGVEGEVYVGGAGLARGYHGRPDLTAAAFIPNPFAGVLGDGCWVLEDSAPVTQHPSPNTRLYKTGDRARFLPSGEIEYLGRVDHQVKIRGFRVELGEIESMLRGHESVRGALVLAREDTPGDKRLVAYVVPKIEDRGSKIEDSGSSAPDPLSSILYPLSSELRGFLKERLPDYMVPAAFVVLDALPLTPNGKIDRRALPAPGTARPELEATFVAPRTFLEEELAAMWRELLRIDRVGVEDNFFVLGGHSLLLMRLASRIHETFDVDLPLRLLFQSPTVVDISRAIAQRLIEDVDPEEFDELLQEIHSLSSDELGAMLETETD